ncbi:hypothetical protein [Erwinia amylovora]|uniref:hypothetical protein n=1 Tax=Erwinia amylovora TaxID=552 RepID=UPI0003A1926D|nr:hypothetical protein [Erwinia amylovora]
MHDNDIALIHVLLSISSQPSFPDRMMPNLSGSYSPVMIYHHTHSIVFVAIKWPGLWSDRETTDDDYGNVKISPTVKSHYPLITIIIIPVATSEVHL